MRLPTEPLWKIGAIVLVSFMVACTSSEAPDNASDGAWVGTITTEGNVTTVVNESGSVWGGTATLVEEASIGVESGAEEYMFGRITGLYATDDEIFVVDEQIPVVRRAEHPRTLQPQRGRPRCQARLGRSDTRDQARFSRLSAFILG